MDALASEGVLFENAFSASTWTRPSAASLLTGLYPLKHGVETFHSVLSANLPRISTLLQARDHQCAGFSTIVQVSKSFGFDHGFDDFYELFRDDKQSNNGFHSPENDNLLPDSKDLNSALFPWLEKHAQKDFFAFVWSMDTHVPYGVPAQEAEFVDEAFKAAPPAIDFKASDYSPEELEYLKQLYDSCIFHNDRQIGKLCQFLKDIQIYDDCLIVVAADHGELFNEHSDPKSLLGQRIARVKSVFSGGENAGPGFYGRRGHIIVPPYDEGTHVPLIFKFPGGKFAGRRVTHLTSLVDVTPTVLKRVAPAGDLNTYHFDGENLLPHMNPTHAEGADEVIYCSGKFFPTSPAYYCVRSHDWKYILTELPEIPMRQLLTGKFLESVRYLRQRYLLANEVLYDLKGRGEGVNVLEEHPEIAERFRKKIAVWREECEQQRQEASGDFGDSDEINKRQLEALGYTS